jgi:N-acetyl-anhydromuramyl-L-alanine amidase AmpD
MTIVQWFQGLWLRAFAAGQPPISPTCSAKSKQCSKSAATTTPKAGGSRPSSKSALQIEDPGLRFVKSLTPIDPKRVKFVVIHHTAESHRTWGIKECHEWHIKGKGWSGIGYNYFIAEDGTAYYGRADAAQDWIGAHVGGYNSTSVGICLDGDFNTQTPSADNLAKVAQLAAMLLKRYRLPVTALRYHSELASKACPGKNFPPRAAFAKLVASEM